MSAVYRQDRRQGPRRLRRQLVQFDRRRYGERRIEQCDDRTGESILVMAASGFFLVVIIVVILVIVA